MILVDSNYLCWVAYYEMEKTNLSHKDIPTAMLYGFLRQVLHIGKRYRTNDFVFCWDSKFSYRKRKYSWYKGNRKPKDKDEEKMRQAVFKQMDVIKDKGVIVYTLPQAEADSWATGFQQVTKQWVAELEKQGKPAREAVEMYKKVVEAKGVSCPAYPVEWH